ncbi:MAG: Ig-like domain-containing protein [Verrucomicrobiota bacterium JB025]|nr:Ig-like domain-containing protein [Verrucomicrobiota bacterium JB025]
MFDDSVLYYAAEGVNQAPTADSQSVAVFEETPTNVSLSAFDLEGSPLTYAVDDTGTLGTLSGTAPNLTYTPPAGYVGADSFTFSVNDGTADSGVATVSIDVVANVAPVATPQNVSTIEETALGITLTGSDSDAGPSPLSYTVDDSGMLGTLTGTAPVLTYTPPAGFVGADSFSFTVSDGLAVSAPATVSIMVTDNIAPVANDQSVTTFPATPIEITLSGSDADNGPEALSFAVVDFPDSESEGSLVVDGALVTFEAVPGFLGDAVFTFTVSDGMETSAPATVTVTVENQAPVADSLAVIAAADTPVEITLSGSDPDGGPDALVYGIASGPSNGTLDVSFLPLVTYTPDGGFVGEDSFTFTVDDGLATSEVATVSITVMDEAVGMIGYTFETAGNIVPTGPQDATTVYTAPDTNSFGSAVTVSALDMTEVDAQYGRVADIGGGSFEATVCDRGGSNMVLFTIDIPATTSVSFASIAFDASYRGLVTGDTTMDWQFETLIDGVSSNVTTGGFTHDGGADYQSPDEASGDIVLTGLSDLSGVSVTFQWTLTGSRNNLWERQTMGIDDIVLIGTFEEQPGVGPVVIELTSGGSGVQLSWASLDGRTYRVEGSADLTADSWTPLESGIMGTGGTLTKSYSITGVGEKYFFRVALEPEAEVLMDE